MTCLRHFGDVQVASFEQPVRWWLPGLFGQGAVGVDMWVFSETVVITRRTFWTDKPVRPLRDAELESLTPQLVLAAFPTALQLNTGRVTKVALERLGPTRRNQSRADFTVEKGRVIRVWFPVSQGQALSRLFRKIYSPNFEDNRGRS